MSLTKQERKLARQWRIENPEEVRQMRADARQKSREFSVDFYMRRRGISREEAEAVVREIADRDRELKRSANAKVTTDVVMSGIHARYAYWRDVYGGKSEHEPVITASDFTWQFLNDAKDFREPVLRSHVQRILDRLVKEGKLRTSTALKNGRECRAYEPVEPK